MAIGIVGQAFPGQYDETDEGIDLSPAPSVDPDGGVDLQERYNTTPVPNEVARHRAEKYNYGLGEKSPGLPELEYSISSGTESPLRERLMKDQALEDKRMKLDIVKEMISAGVTDPSEIDMIMNAEPNDLKNPDTFFEKRFAAKMMTEAAVLDYDPETTEIDGVTFSNLADAEREDPEDAGRIMDWAERVKTNQELDLKIMEDLEARWAAEGIASTVSNYAEMVTPFLSWYRMSSRVAAAEPSSILLGNNMEEQYEYLNTLGVDERNTAIKAAVEELYERNPLDAMTFMQGLVSWTGTDKFLNNLVSVTDLSLPFPAVGIIPAKTYLKLGTAGTQKLHQVSKSILKATSGRVATPALVADAAGEVPKAGLLSVLNRLHQKGKATTIQPFPQFIEPAATIFNPKAVAEGVEKTTWASRDYSLKLQETLEENAETLLRHVVESPVVGARLTADSAAQLAGLQETREIMNRTYGRGSDVVIDVAPVDPTDTIGNVNYAKVTIGQKDSTLFESAEQALKINKDWYGFKEVRVRVIGGKYALEVLVPVDETAPLVRNALALETEKNPVKSLGTLYLPFFRSADDLASARVVEESKSAIMGGQELAALAKQIAQPITKLKGVFSNKEFKQLEKFMAYQRDFKKGKGEERGVFSDNIGEFSRDWYDYHKTMPSEKQATAYFVARQLNDIGWIGTNLSLYRDKARMGLQLFYFGKSASNKPTIEGKLVRPEVIFESTESAGVVLLDDVDPGASKYFHTKFISEKKDGFTLGQLKEKLATGEYKVVQLSPTGMDAIKAEYLEMAKGWKGDVNFVISKNTRSRPLEFKQIPYRPGGHVELDDGYFIRQAMISQHNVDNAVMTTYSGDKNLYHFTSKQEGERIIKNLEHARKLYLEGQTNKLKLLELKTFLNKSNLPHTYSEFVRLFKGKKGDTPKYDLKQEFKLTRKNESIESQHKISKNYANFTSRADNEYNLYKGGINLQWAGERGDHLLSVVNDGTTTNPTYKYSPARHIDPVNTLNRATNNMMKGRFLDEYKHVAAEDFIARFSDILDYKDLQEVRANPFKALLDGRFKESKEKADLVKYAKANRRAVLEFLGTKSEHQKAMDFSKAKLWQDTFKNEKDMRRALDALQYTDGWMFGAIKDPVTAMRAFAFHTKLGLFNPMQFFLQAQTVVHAIGVAGPVHGMKGLEAAIYQRAMLLAPQHADAIAAKSVLGNKVDDLKEALDWGQRTGWFRVGREVAVASDHISSDVIGTRWGNFLEAGTKPFREGERLSRMTAWNAAFLEWRAKNPTAKMTNETARSILNRADLLSVNMTAASNASWQRGLLGVPTQFFAFQARLAEQFLGKRLKPREKWRAFATYGAMYGFPVALGAPAAVVPAHEMFKEYFLEKGIDVDDAGTMANIANEGILSVLGEFITGEQYNVGERWGPGGLPFLRDIINGDTTILEAFGGVSGTSIADTIKAMDPYAHKILSIVTPGAEPYPITMEDHWALARSINTGNSLFNAWNAINTGKMIAKSGSTTASDVDTTDGLLNLFLGLTPQRISDVYKMLNNTQALEEYQKEGVKEATKEWRRSMKEGLSLEDRQAHEKRAQHIMQRYDLPSDKRMQAIRNAATNENTVESIGWEYAKQSKAKLDYYDKQQMKKAQ